MNQAQAMDERLTIPFLAVKTYRPLWTCGKVLVWADAAALPITGLFVVSDPRRRHRAVGTKFNGCFMFSHDRREKQEEAAEAEAKEIFREAGCHVLQTWRRRRRTNSSY